MTAIRVLIVDDNKDAATSLSRLMELLGKETRVVHDGASALATIPEYRPNAVVLDLGLPGMDGIAAANQIRALAEGQNVVLIALTGWGEEQDRRRTQNAGFDAHLVKPVNVEQLEMTLKNLLAARSPAQ